MASKRRLGIPTSQRSTSKSATLKVELNSYPSSTHPIHIAPSTRGVKKPSSVKHKPVFIDLTQDDDDDEAMSYGNPYFRVSQHFTPNNPPFPYNAGVNPNGIATVSDPDEILLPPPSSQHADNGKIWLPSPHSNYPKDPLDKPEPVHPHLPYHDNRKHQPPFTPLPQANYPGVLTQAQLIFPWLPQDRSPNSSYPTIPAPPGLFSPNHKSPLRRRPLAYIPPFHPAFNHAGLPYLPKSTPQPIHPIAAAAAACVRLDDDALIRAICTWRNFGMSFEEIAAEVRKTGFEDADEERVKGICESGEVVSKFGC